MVRSLDIRAVLVHCAALCASAVLAQPLTLTTQVVPPYSASYANYFQSSSQVLIQLLSTDNNTRSIYLAGSITNLDGSISVSVAGGTPWAAPPLQVPFGFNMFTGADLEPFMQNGGGAVVYTGITEDDIRTGLLPEGEYRICLQAFDYFTNAPLSGEDPSGCSNVFTITFPQAPVIISPECGSSVPVQQPQMQLFNWQLPGGQPAGAVIQYTFELVLWPDGIDALSALDASNDPVFSAEVTVPTLFYSQAFPPLIPGKRYAWRVRAVDVAGQTVFQHNGYSDPCSFTYANNNGFTLAYPLNGDTLPWDFMPIVQRYEPYSDDIIGFHSAMKLYHNGSLALEHERELVWAQGPQQSQSDALGVQISQEHAQQINIYRRPDEGIVMFDDGDNYSVQASITLDTEDRPAASSGDIAGTFVNGMGVPRLSEPANNSVIAQPAGGSSTIAPVKLRFRTAEPPNKLLPDFRIFQSQDHVASQTDGHIYERWTLEVSTDPTFQVYGASESATVGGLLSLLNTAQSEEYMVNELYKEVEFDFAPPDTGTYYWRVRWMKDHNSAFGEAYRSSAVWKFRITGQAVAQTNTDVVRPPECLAECRANPVPLADRIAVDSVSVGDTVRVGLFTMRVNMISYSGVAATGEGVMDVPFMKAPLRVGFSNVRICSVHRGLVLYEGSVNGKYDNTGILPSSWVQGGSLFTGFTPAVAQQIDQYLNTSGRVVSQFTGSTPMGLPIGIDTDLPEGRLIVGIVGMHFTDTLATLNAAMGLPMHDFGTTVGLGNMNIPFHPGGVGDLGDEGTLYLLGDVNAHVGGGDTLRLEGTRFTTNFQQVVDSGTFVSWDCKGFRALQVQGQWRFSQEHLLEDLPNGNDGPNKIIGAFKVRTGRSGFIARVSFNKPWHMKGARGWGVDVQEAWIDRAEHMNPPDIAYPGTPEMLEALDLDDGIRDPLWKGIWVKRAMLRLPEGLHTFDNPDRISAQIDNLIYDSHKLSGSIKVANLIGPDLGDLNGWGFSMDTLQVDIIANSFAQGGFSGSIHLPITDTLLVYSAMLQQDISTDDWRAQFLLHPKDTINANIYVGTMHLEPTSHLEAVIGDAVEGNFATVELNGKLTVDRIAPAVGRLNFRDIGFEQLTFSTASPYTNVLDREVWSFASPQKYLGGSAEDDAPDAGGGTPRKVGGFPISITRVQSDRRTIDGKPAAGLLFDLNLNLSGETNIFVATTRIALLGTLNTTGMHKWGGHSVELDSIGVTGEVGAVRMEGGLRWYNGSTTYGDGIKGVLNAWFLKGKLQVRAAAQFGTVGSLKYWYADAMLAKAGGFSPGNAFNVFGFGGGAWYHMKRTGAMPSAQQVTQQEVAQQDDPDAVPGLTLSGVTMVPDAATKFGFQATVVFGDGASGRAYNGDLSAGMTFSESGGVSTAFLDGNVYLMSDRNDREYVPIRGTAHVSFDFPNDVFSANFQVYVEVGSGMVTGTGPNNLAGEADILVTPDTWHFFVGKPQTPIGLDFLGFIRGDFYFMVGKDLPPPIPPPTEVASIVPASFWNRPDLPNADGIAFGSRVSLGDTLKFLLFKLRMAAEIGYDIMFRPVGEMECAGVTDPGIVGWYATGQLYGYVSGGVSLYVDVGFYDGEYHIFDVSAAALMRGGFANPSWARGAVDGHYSILDGWVSGYVTFPFQLGQPCVTPPGGLLSGLDPLGDLSPHDQEGIGQAAIGVDCGVEPEAVFNMKVGPQFTVTATLEDGRLEQHTFRLVLDKFELREKTGDVLLATTLNVAPDNMQVTLWPAKYLKPNTVHTVTIRIKAEELVNGVWVPGLNKEHVQATWTRTNMFRTGAGIEELGPTDIDYSYPFVGQRFLLQDECRSGIIQCKSDMSGQPVFKAPVGRKRSFRAVFVPLTGGANITREAVVEHNGKSIITFTVPPLLNDRAYSLKLVARDELDLSTLSMSAGPAPGSGGSPTQAAASPASALQMTAVSSTTTSQAEGMVHVIRRTISGYTLRADEKLVYTYAFRTSLYNTLPVKAAALQNSSTSINATEMDPLIGQTLIPSFTGERFDVFDIKGYPYTSHACAGCFVQPLVGMQDAHIDQWYKTYAKPVLYDYYALIKASNCSSMQLSRYLATTYVNNGIFITTGTAILDHPDTIGIPPMRTVKLSAQTPPASALSTNESAPASSFGISTTVLSNQVAGAAPSTPQPASPDMTYYLTTSVYVYNDNFRLKTITPDVIAHCGPPNAVELPMDEPMRSAVLKFQNTPYRRVYKGNYGISFYFRPPPTCTPFLDSGETGAPPSMGNAVFYNPSGVAAPPPTHGGSPGQGAVFQNQ